MEYALTTSIKKLTVLDKPVIGILQGHGEPGPQELAQVYQSLSILYNVETIDLKSTDQIEERFKTIALVAPQDTMVQSDFSKLDQFLGRGGHLFVAFDRVVGDLQNASGSAVDNGLAGWLSAKGIVVDDSFVTDASCGQVTVQQKSGFLTFNNQISFPFLPLVNFNIEKEWTNADFPQHNIPMGAVLEGNFGGPPAKLIVVSDGAFPVSGQRGQNPDNVSLMVNSIDWLSDDTGLIELRTKGVSSRPIEELEDGRRSFLKYGNFLMPIALVLLYGFFRNQRSNKVRMKRMQERWV